MRSSLLAVLFFQSVATGAEPPPARVLKVPAGFTVTRVAAPPMVDRPVVACLDDQGRLYVADSSGSNEKPIIQLEKKPHRIVRLTDTNGDGTYDKSEVFADGMSFLQGVLWYKGSLYVGAPPYILKLTDTDNDGQADKREIWFDGKTLTGCANDLHGPYLGPDDYFYWTKGAFAKQDYTLQGKPWTTKAAHIFRAKPDGSHLEPVMIGGMDNPVEVVFTPKGDLIFNTTFLQNPGNGLRDGLIHNVHGAVYGKDHDPVYGHPWTWPNLMPPMTHMGPAAPSGLCRVETECLGPEYRNQLFCTQFNLRTVSRHALVPFGSTYRTVDTPFVTSDDVDFHPTDVLEDRDGSLLVIDTGGWYKLCCPSSQMIKADVLGGIYRIRRKGMERPLITSSVSQIPPLYWVSLNRDQAGYSLALAGLKDKDMHTRRLAAEALGRIGNTQAVPALLAALADETNDRTLDHALTYALIELNDPKATREGLKAASPLVRRAALAALSAMPKGDLKATEVVIALHANDANLRDTGWWVTGKHPEWAEDVRAVLVQQLKAANTEEPGKQTSLVLRTAKFAKATDAQTALGELLAQQPGNRVLLAAMAQSGLKTLPRPWLEGLRLSIASDNLSVVRAAWSVVRAVPIDDATTPKAIADKLYDLNSHAKWPDDVTLMQLSTWPQAQRPFAKLWSEYGAKAFHRDAESTCRSLAVEIAGHAKLTPEDYANLTSVLPTAHVSDFPRLLAVFAKSTDTNVGLNLVKTLAQESLKPLLRTEQLKPVFEKYPAKVKAEAELLYAKLDAARAGERDRLQKLIQELPKGNARRGQQVFESAQANCKACHKIGYVGSTIGPDLTRIGGIRTNDDLLESIVYPSASFVRSYEPVKVTLKDGRVLMGLASNETAEEMTLVVSATETIKLERSKIEEVTPGTVSIMPAGLDTQITKQELADLVAYLKGCQ